MSSFSKNGYSAGRNNKAYRPPKRDGIFNTSFLESGRSSRNRSGYDKSYSAGRTKRRSTQSCFKNFFE